MSSNSLGACFRITTFGESHGPAVGVVIDGVLPGMALDESMVQADLDRRRPGHAAISSRRVEPDRAEILSGVFKGKTTGAPICILVRNRDARPKDYEAIKDVFRPGHADFTFLAKYGIRDWRGGGRSSGRETVARAAAGAVARRLLAQEGIAITGYVTEAAGVKARAIVPGAAETNVMRCPDPAVAEKMQKAVTRAGMRGDSTGGIVEVTATGVPAGWGDPVFWKLDAEIAGAMMSIGAVKGVEIGAGFAAARMKGSEHNDQMNAGGFITNHAGGMLGGISTVDRFGRERTIAISGRHDRCLCPRVVPVAESMLAVVLAEACLRQQAISRSREDITGLRLAIDAADREFLRSLARRFSLARDLAGLKRRDRTAVSQPAREAEVRRAWTSAARAHGFERILDAILRASRSLQKVSPRRT